MPYFILSLVIQVALVVHVVKTGRNMSWIFILLFFPLIGTIAYAIVELLPEFQNSRGAYQARRTLSKAINPDKDLQVATRNLAVADTMKNAVTLAGQYLDRSQFAEAKELFERWRKGVHADDPLILIGLARAQFGLGEYAEVVKTLDALKASNPAARSPEGHLLYARALEQLGELDTAMQEYEALRKYYPGPEPTCRLALICKQRGETQRAGELFAKVASESEVAGKHYNTVHKEWVVMARREVQK